MNRLPEISEIGKIIFFLVEVFYGTSRCALLQQMYTSHMYVCVFTHIDCMLWVTAG
jgi:hypothetical protein